MQHLVVNPKLSKCPACYGDLGVQDVLKQGISPDPVKQSLVDKLFPYFARDDAELARRIEQHYGRADAVVVGGLDAIPSRVRSKLLDGLYQGYTAEVEESETAAAAAAAAAAASSSSSAAASSSDPTATPTLKRRRSSVSAAPPTPPSTARRRKKSKSLTAKMRPQDEMVVELCGGAEGRKSGEMASRDGSVLPQVVHPFVITDRRTTVSQLCRYIASQLQLHDPTDNDASALDPDTIVVVCRGEVVAPAHSLHFIDKTRWADASRCLQLRYFSSQVGLAVDGNSPSKNS